MTNNAQKRPQDYDNWRAEMKRQERRSMALVALFSVALTRIILFLAVNGVGR